MSIYSDYKCGAISYNEMVSIANQEARRDRALQEAEDIKWSLNNDFDTTIKNFLEEEYGLDAYVEYSYGEGAYTVVYDMNNNNEILLTVESEDAEDLLDALAYLEENGELRFPTIYEDYKLYREFMKILKNALKDEQFKKRWMYEENFATDFYEQTVKTINIA